MNRRRANAAWLLGAAALAVGCAAASPPPAVPVAPSPPVIARPAEPPPPEFPAVVVRVRKGESGFVAEVLDVRGAEPDPRPLDGDARRDAVRRLEHLLDGRATVVDGRGGS